MSAPTCPPPRRGARLVLAAALALGACAAPRPPATLLTLPPSVPLASSPAAPLDARAPTLALRRVGLPEYLLARRVRYRADAATLADWPDTYWAERIEVAASREFSAALRAALPGWSICEADCAERTPVLALQVELGALDAVRPARRLQARARWVVSTVGTGSATTAQLTQEQGFDLPMAADTPQAQAQAMTELLRQLAQASAAAVVSARR